MNCAPKIITKCFPVVVLKSFYCPTCSWFLSFSTGGHNVTISLQSRTGHTHMPSVVGVLVFTQFWFWFPLSHFLSLAYTPTCVIGLNKDLKVCLWDLVFIVYLLFHILLTTHSKGFSWNFKVWLGISSVKFFPFKLHHHLVEWNVLYQ